MAMKTNKALQAQILDHLTLFHRLQTDKLNRQKIVFFLA